MWVSQVSPAHAFGVRVLSLDDSVELQPLRQRGRQAVVGEHCFHVVYAANPEVATAKTYYMNSSISGSQEAVAETITTEPARDRRSPEGRRGCNDTKGTSATFNVRFGRWILNLI